MIEFETSKPSDAVRGVRAMRAGAALSHGRVLEALRDGDECAAGLCACIAATRFDAVLWEMPPLTRERLALDFECVLTDSPALARLRRDPATFGEHFRDAGPVAVFENLGGDALLVAPAPDGERDYTHLAAFCRNAPASVRRQFWSMLAGRALARIGDAPLWISTSGLGVGWLHARLDTRPKYYSHDPYRRWPP